MARTVPPNRLASPATESTGYCETGIDAPMYQPANSTNIRARTTPRFGKLNAAGISTSTEDCAWLSSR
jgi:hypothetical protein